MYGSSRDTDIENSLMDRVEGAGRRGWDEQKQDHGNNLMSIKQRMDKEDMVHIYNGILFSHKKE